MADLTLIAPPRISRAQFARILSAAGSPAAPEAAPCYDAIIGYGIDPAVALAFFEHESSFGTRGVATRTRNWGNLRRSQGSAREERDGWAWYDTWTDSARDWAALIARHYVARLGLTTVGAVLPVYAPTTDGNRPERYAAAVRAAVAAWQAVDIWAAWGDLQPPDDARAGWAIPQRWLAEQRGGRGLGAALTVETYNDDGRLCYQEFERGLIVYWPEADAVGVVWREP